MSCDSIPVPTTNPRSSGRISTTPTPPGLLTPDDAHPIKRAELAAKIRQRNFGFFISLRYEGAPGRLRKLPYCYRQPCRMAEYEFATPLRAPLRVLPDSANRPLRPNPARTQGPFLQFIPPAIAITPPPLIKGNQVFASLPLQF